MTYNVFGGTLNLTQLQLGLRPQGAQLTLISTWSFLFHYLSVVKMENKFGLLLDDASQFHNYDYEQFSCDITEKPSSVSLTYVIAHKLLSNLPSYHVANVYNTLSFIIHIKTYLSEVI